MAGRGQDYSARRPRTASMICRAARSAPIDSNGRPGRRRPPHLGTRGAQLARRAVRTTSSPGHAASPERWHRTVPPADARALYGAERARGTGHNPALRKLASRLVGIMHGCLKTRTLYDEAIAWPHHEIKLAA